MNDELCQLEIRGCQKHDIISRPRLTSNQSLWEASAMAERWGVQGMLWKHQDFGELVYVRNIRVVMVTGAAMLENAEGCI